MWSLSMLYSWHFTTRTMFSLLYLISFTIQLLKKFNKKTIEFNPTTENFHALVTVKVFSSYESFVLDTGSPFVVIRWEAAVGLVSRFKKNGDTEIASSYLERVQCPSKASLLGNNPTCVMLHYLARSIVAIPVCIELEDCLETNAFISLSEDFVPRTSLLGIANYNPFPLAFDSFLLYKQRTLEKFLVQNDTKGVPFIFQLEKGCAFCFKVRSIRLKMNTEVVSIAENTVAVLDTGFPTFCLNRKAFAILRRTVVNRNPNFSDFDAQGLSLTHKRDFPGLQLLVAGQSLELTFEDLCVPELGRVFVSECPVEDVGVLLGWAFLRKVGFIVDVATDTLVLFK